VGSLSSLFNLHSDDQDQPGDRSDDGHDQRQGIGTTGSPGARSADWTPRLRVIAGLDRPNSFLANRLEDLHSGHPSPFGEVADHVDEHPAHRHGSPDHAVARSSSSNSSITASAPALHPKAQAAHPLRPADVKPAMNLFCNERNNPIMGRIMITPAALVSPQSRVNARWNARKLVVTGMSSWL
jgi:hypothetical protein